MDIYFKQKSFSTNAESIREFIKACITVDLYNLYHLGKMKICVYNKDITVREGGLFSKKVQKHLNANYYEYVTFMNKYLAHKKCNKI